MDLPNLFSSNTEMETRIQICIILTDTTVQALLLRITMEETRILHKSPVLTYTDGDTLTIRADESLQELGKESENINEVIFVLPPSWLKSGDVVAVKKPLMQKMTTDLALRPVGFLVQSETIIQNSLSHNIHFSAVLLLITAEQIAVTVVTQGKAEATQLVGRSQDIAADLQEAFARYLNEKNETHLPGKLICTSFSLTEEVLVSCQQKLLDTSWGEKAPFVQTPTIDVIKPELSLSIVAQQAGDAVMGLHKSEMQKMPEEKPQSEHQSKKESHEMGFETVDHKNLEKVDDEERAVEVAKDFLPTSFGIPIKPSKMKALPDEEEELAIETPHSAAKAAKGGLFAGLLSSSKGKHNVKLFIGGGVLAGIVTVLVGGYLYLLFFSTVRIELTPVVKTVASDVTLTLDPKLTAPDAENLRIPAQTVSKNLKTQTSGTTSGVKIVGDKAKGEVVIYNNTTSEKTFVAGTVVQSGEIQFLIDKDVTIPAAKVEDGKNSQGNPTKLITASEAKVTATAYVIGVESNIAKDIELSVANFDKNTYMAKSTGEFTGGSSREVRVVSKEDQDLLLSEAKKNLLRDAQEEFKAESGNGTFILPTDEVTITKAIFSDELESAADELVLDVEGKVSAVSYKAADLVPLAQAVLGSKVPPAYALSDETPEILSAPAKQNGKETALVLQANLSAKAKPQLDPSSLTLELAGKSLEEVPGVFKTTGVIQSNTIQFTPPLAKNVIRKLPSNKDKITVTWTE